MSEEEIRLPSKFIQVHALSAPKGKRYTCVICNSDGAYLCTECRTCYCCREHLLLDDLACHAILCERESAIREILKLPLATRSRPETAGRLEELRDECRRVSYLESRRHVLEGNNELALPAAERSLHFAREVHGQSSPDLVPPLLALADVATLAGAKDAARGYVSRAEFLIEERVDELRAECQPELRREIAQNLENFAKIRPDLIGDVSVLSNSIVNAAQDLSESGLGLGVTSLPREEEPPAHGLESGEAILSLSKQTEFAGKSPDTSNGDEKLANSESLDIPPLPGTKKTPLQIELDAMLENSLRDEIYRTSSGASLAFLESRYWTSQTRVLVSEKDFSKALEMAANALYFATLACGVDSLQTSLQIYSVAKLGLFSEEFTEIESVNALIEAENIFRDAILRFYSPMVGSLEILRKEQKILVYNDYENALLRKLVDDYNKAEAMREEDKLGFRADVKEAIESAVFSLEYIERYFGVNSEEYYELSLIIGIGLACVEDMGKEEWSASSRDAAVGLEQLLNAEGEEEGEIGAAWLLLHVYRCLFA